MPTPTIAPQTHETEHLNPETRRMEREQPLHNHLRELVSHVARSSEYRELRQHNTTHVEAYATAIEKITSDEHSGFSDKDTALLKTTALLGQYVEAENEITRLRTEQERRGGYLDNADFNRMKKLKGDYLIPFNHSIKLLINEAPNLTMHELTNSLGEAYVGVFRQYDALYPKNGRKDPNKLINRSFAENRIESTINGMRHELAVEAMLESQADHVGYNYNITPQQDAQGIDIIIEYDGYDIPVDLKASPTAEAKALDKHPNSTIAWTTLHNEDFTGMNGRTPNAVTIPYATAERQAQDFLARVGVYV